MAQANNNSGGGGGGPPHHSNQQRTFKPEFMSGAGPADGTGQTIGFVQFDTFLRSDVSDYLALIGLPQSRMDNLSQVHVNGGAPLGADQSEVLLDVKTALTIAPGAKLVVYDAPLGSSFQSVFNAAINGGSTIISNSWAYCESQTTLADVLSIEAILQSAAASGISVFNASGDSGSTCLDGSANTVAVPASSPSATAVGGSSVQLTPGLTYGTETWWDGTAATPPTGSGGFGVSKFFSRPSYQDGISASPMRSVPDVVANADPAHGFIICQASNGGCPNGKWYGGTSRTAPMWAAFTARLNHALGGNLGAANPQLYPLGLTNGFRSAASMGSDFAHVGLGSPNVVELYLALAGQTAGLPDAATSSLLAFVPGNALQELLPNGYPADGMTAVLIRVQLQDANGNTVHGKTVSLTANPGSHALITPANGVSTVDNGTVVFSVTNDTAEEVTFTATDTSDGIVIAQTVTIPFVPRRSTAGSIFAAPTMVQNNGIAATTITVTLKDALNNPSPGKVVRLSQGSGRSVISGPTPSITDAAGKIEFLATNNYPEVVTYSAVDVSDGNLPVPGTAVVTFSGQANASCVGVPPVGAPGYALTAFSTGYQANNFFFSGINFGGCPGVSNPAFDTVGNVFAAVSPNGNLYKFAFAADGSADSSGNVLANLGLTVGPPVFGKDGSLYITRAATNAGATSGNIQQVSQETGAVLRTVASNLTCPGPLAVDPLSGDLFFTDICFGGALANPSLFRIQDPGSATPVLSVYATLPGTPNGAVAIAPDGTIYVAGNYTSTNLVVRVSGTNTPAPAAVTTMAGINSIYWVTIGQVLPSGAAKSLIVLAPAGLNLVDITTTPFTSTPLTIGGIASGIVGPDGCLYTSGSDTIYKLAPTAGGCGFSPTNTAPGLRLSPATQTPVQGTLQTMTAEFVSVSVPADTPVIFGIRGANGDQFKLGRTDANGKAMIDYTGAFVGKDTVVASATVGANTLKSNAIDFTWTAGKHPTFLSLNNTQSAGAVGVPVTFTASLFDIASSPAMPVAGATINFSLGAQNCNAMTGVGGAATCMLTPPAAGTYVLAVNFAGDAGTTPASALKTFQATTPAAFDTALDAPGLPWSSGGNVPWITQTVVTADGVDAAQSGAIGDNQTSLLETTITGPGMVDFDWKSSSEAFVDRLDLLLDGALVAHRSGDKDWLGMKLPIPDGTHTVGWQYRKNASISEGSDAAWVDRVSFTPIANAWNLTVENSGVGSGRVLSAPVTVDCDFGPNLPGACTSRLPQGVYRLYPLVDSGFYLVTWTGCDAVWGQVCVVTVDRDRSVSATYAFGKDNRTQVQEAYVAYYGRPGDLGGLIFWWIRLNQVNGDLAALIQSFGNSAEANFLFGGMSDHDTVVTLYRQILGRDPEPGGLAYWVNELATGKRTRQAVALDLLNGAQNQDRVTVIQRVLAADAFTGDIARHEALVGMPIYAGDAAAARLRLFLGGVTDHLLSLDEFLFDVPGFIDRMPVPP